MDTSETYIAMADCDEIQNKDMGGLYKMETPWKDILCYSDGEKANTRDIWLPRQDQIQEMMRDKFSTRELVPATERLHKFAKKYWLHSFEQLWLAFFMHEKHSKIWSEGKWVKK